MYYRIVKITDLKGLDKLDNKSVGRIGRVIDMEESTIVPNKSALLVCVMPGHEKSLMTSRVKKLSVNPGEIVIWTENSIYTLRVD